MARFHMAVITAAIIIYYIMSIITPWLLFIWLLLLGLLLNPSYYDTVAISHMAFITGVIIIS